MDFLAFILAFVFVLFLLWLIIWHIIPFILKVVLTIIAIIFAILRPEKNTDTSTNTGAKTNMIIKEVTVPNPATASDEKMIKYIHSTFSSEVDAVYKELNKQDIHINPFIRRAFEEKIKGHFLSSEEFLAFIYPAISLVKEKNYQNEYSFGVDGIRKKNRKKYIRKQCEKYDFVTLIPKLDKFNNNVIMVKCWDDFIGYVPDDERERVYEIIKQPHIAYILWIFDDEDFDPDASLEVEIMIKY